MRRTALVRRSAAALLTPLALSVLVACGSDSGEDGAAASAPSASADAGDSEAGDKKGGTSGAKDGDDAEGADDGDTDSGETADDGDDGDETPAGTKAPRPAPTPGTELTPKQFVDLFKSSMDSSARMTMTVEGPVSSRAEGVVDYGANPPAMAMTMDNAELGGQVKFVLLDNVMYMNMGQLSNDKYIKMDLDDPSGLLGQDISSQVDPKASMDQLAKGIKKVRFAGTEQLDGTEARRYDVILDARSLGAGDPGAAGLPKQMTYSVWFDDQDRLRKTVMAMGRGNGTVTMTLRDWGAKVDIKKPPAGQVTEMPQGM